MSLAEDGERSERVDLDRVLNNKSPILNTMQYINKDKGSHDLFKNEHARNLRKDERELKTILSDIKKRESDFAYDSRNK